MTRRSLIVWCVAVPIGVFVCDALGIVKVTYPKVADEVRFASTRTVAAFDGEMIRTREGEIFRITGSQAEKANEMRIWLPLFGNQIGVRGLEQADGYELSYKKHGMVCGTPFAGLLTVPLIPVTVAKTHRVNVLAVLSGEPNKALEPTPGPVTPRASSGGVK